MSFRDIAADYIRHHRERAAAELSYFHDLPSEEEAVSVAAMGEYPNGKRHSLHDEFHLPHSERVDAG